MHQQIDSPCNIEEKVANSEFDSTQDARADIGSYVARVESDSHNAGACKPSTELKREEHICQFALGVGCPHAVRAWLRHLRSWQKRQGIRLSKIERNNHLINWLLNIKYHRTYVLVLCRLEFLSLNNTEYEIIFK